jgi:ParB family chromosome partitioning protein
MRRKALGKGLSALLGDPEPTPIAGEAPVASLDPNPYQPRASLRPEALAELAQSIRESGIVQPILVRPRGDRYQIIAGERRWRAAQQVGLTHVPIAVRDVPDEQLLELALVENIQRAELSPVEEAQAYHRLQDEFGLTQDQVAAKVGRERSTVANMLRLLRLPAEIRSLMDSGQLDAGHARALLALDDEQVRLELAREAARRSLSVREVERRVAQLRAPVRRTAPRRDPNTRAAEEKLRAALGTRVEIRRHGRGGVVRIAFASEPELQRLFDTIVRAARARG